MSESFGSEGQESPAMSIDALGPPPAPPAPPQLYDAERNKQWGVVTVEETEAEFRGTTESLAARVRQDKARRQAKTWDDKVECASDGVRLGVLHKSLKGTKQSTEAMVRMTGYSTPTTQTRIQLGEFFVWAAPQLWLEKEQSQVEAEPGRGVGDFEMPSDRLIIERGREEAKKAGCWGLPQIIMIAGAENAVAVAVADLPKNVGWKKGRKSPFPWWEDQGPLASPWQEFHLVIERPDPSQQQDSQQGWSVDLFARDNKPVTLHQRGFVARFADGVLLGSADALDRFRPHVKFTTPKTKDVIAAGDLTGKQHLTLDDMAAKLGMASGALGERLRGQGYLNLQGEATPAALDAGITQIVHGGTQFCFDAIKNLLNEVETERAAPDTSVEWDRPPGQTSASDEPADPTTASSPVEQDRPIAEINPADETVDIITTDKPGERDQPAIQLSLGAQPVSVPAELRRQEPEEADNTPGRVTVWRGGGMQQVTAAPRDQLTTDADEVNQPATGPAPGTVSDVADPESGGRQTVEKLQSGMEILLAAEKALVRRTPDGEFVPHAGDNAILRSRIKMAAEAMVNVHTILTSALPAYQASLASVDMLTMKVQQGEAENAELKHRVQEQQATIMALEQASAEHAQVIPFRAAPDTEDGAATASAH